MLFNFFHPAKYTLPRSVRTDRYVSIIENWILTGETEKILDQRTLYLHNTIHNTSVIIWKVLKQCAIAPQVKLLWDFH